MWRQRVLIKKIINRCNFTKTDKILDIPCGTGFIGKILCETSASVTASDISAEMMKRASDEYGGDNFKGFVECDITKTPFSKESFDCVIVLAFMHRLPKEIRDKTWEEVVRISKKYVIVNYGFDSRLQRLKKWFLKGINANYIPAPSSLPMDDIITEINSFGFVIKKVYNVAYFFSGKVIFFLKTPH
jgi:ubiquinone/menaquinone biosynthesis C-methylase UbiE